MLPKKGEERIYVDKQNKIAKLFSFMIKILIVRHTILESNILF